MARYVKQSKYLEQLKTSEEVWASSFPTAKYLMFSKGRALLTSKSPIQSKINWRTFEGRDLFQFRYNNVFEFLKLILSSSLEIEPYCPDVKKNSVVLGVDEDSEENRALFACAIKPEEAFEEVQTKYEGKFADMRVAIITLNAVEAQLVGRVIIVFRIQT